MRTSDRMVVGTAEALEGAIDRTRRVLGRCLTRVQRRLRRVSVERRPVDNDLLSHHREMMRADGNFSVSPGVSAVLDEMKDSVPA